MVRFHFSCHFTDGTEEAQKLPSALDWSWKNMICSSKIKRENHQKPAGSWREHERNQTGRIVQRKGKNFRQGWVLFKTQMNNTMLQSRISLSGVVEFLSFFWSSSPPLQLLKKPSHFLLIPSLIKSLILALSNSVLGKKKKFLQTGLESLESDLRSQVRILLATWFCAFTLNNQMRISWVFDTEIRRFKNPNLSTHTGLQLSWRIQSEINSFWRTKSGLNLVGKKGSPDLIQKLTMPSIPIWLRVWHKNNGPQDPIKVKINFLTCHER